MVLSRRFLERREVYIKKDVIWFFSHNSKYHELSNMFLGMPIKFKDKTWNSSEALYQACKYPYNPEIREKILKAKTPIQAKRVQEGCFRYIRKDWNDIQIDVMLWVLKLKAQQHEEFRKVLIKTHKKIIVEKSSKDTYWGCLENKLAGTLVGFNVLGKLLIYVRDNLDSILEEDLAKESFLLQ